MVKKINTQDMLKKWIILTLIFFIHAGHTNNGVNQTKTKLKDLDSKISKLQQTLILAHDKQGLLNKELAETEKKIGKAIRETRAIHQDMAIKQHGIIELEQQVSQLNEQLKTQQQLLIQHVRARYNMGEHEPLKWLLNVDDPYKISRMLTFYQYLIQSRQHAIDEVKETKNKIDINEAKLNQELLSQQQLQINLTLRQQQLEQEKSYQGTLIHSLDQDISSTKQTLEEYHRDKVNLSHLLHELMQQNPTFSNSLFEQMRHKLPSPVKVDKNTLQKMNQGITFFAPEGESVSAVHAGKVVFSDWLKGYGLLLILDHGQGFMTLYAHNQSLYKQKGETVIQGEQIAAIGHSGGLKQNGLYFEVRHRGKAIPPLEWLS